MTASDATRHERAALGLMAYWGYVAGVNYAAAPLLAASFGVSEPVLASAFAWIGVASLAALALGRIADRIGRRRIALAASAGLPFASVASALAPSLAAYVGCQLVAYACGTALLGTLVVMTSEHAEPAQRASAQARAGAAFTLGAALPLLLCAAIAPGGIADAERWRWLWWAATPAALLWPLATRVLRETPRWRGWQERAPRARRAGLGPCALRLLGAAAVVAAAEVATRSWLFLHAVRALGLPPRHAVLVMGAGGLASLLGFGAGARLADRVGRRTAFAVAAACFATGAIGYFGISLATTRDPAPLLLASLAMLGIGGNAATTAFRSHATELTPTSARGALTGAMAVAASVGWIASMSITSALARVCGAFGLAVAALVAMAVPVAVVLVLSLPETAGANLEAPGETIVEIAG